MKKVGLVVLATLGSLAVAQPARAQVAGPQAAAGPAVPAGPADPDAIVTALKAVAGNPPRARASFARGRCVRGDYAPAPEASRVTRSASFTKPSTVLGRFSVGGGNPAVADTNGLVLRGLSVRLGGDGEGGSDLLLENAPVHFARTLDQMLGFLRARLPGPDGKPDPARMKGFSEANPETLNQARFVAARPLPGSFAGVVYWGVHAFPATDAAGRTRFVKFKAVPAAGEIALGAEEAKSRPADFLTRDLADRLATGAVRFDILALLDRPGDPTTDVTVRWPDEDGRETVRLGTLTIAALEPDATCDGTTFDPSHLADGIGFPPDEMFEARKTAYAISLSRRAE